MLRDYYKPHEYGKVILPFCVLKRFNDCLIPTKDKVLQTWENVKHLEVKSGFLERAAGYSFYNISKYDFGKLTEDATHIEDNFRNYINGGYCVTASRNQILSRNEKVYRKPRL